MIKNVESKSQRRYWQSTEKLFKRWISMTRADNWDIGAQKMAIWKQTKEVVRQNIIAARDMIKCHPLTPELATELFTSKGIRVFCFSAALIEWFESELNDVKRSCVQAYKNAWHLPQSTASALFIFPKTHAVKESTLLKYRVNSFTSWSSGIHIIHNLHSDVPLAFEPHEIQPYILYTFWGS